MKAQTKLDFRKINDAIKMLSRDDRTTNLETKVGDNPRAVAATLNLIQELCEVIRLQENLAG
jgi:hypothetical protein